MSSDPAPRMSLAEWLKESKRMRVNVRSMERSNIVDELSGEQRDISRSREETFDNTKKKLAYFKTNLMDIKDRLAEVTTFRSHSGALQKSLESFESKLTSYKSTMRAEFDSLANEEAFLFDDLEIFLQRVESWYRTDKESLHAEESSGPSLEQKIRSADRYDKHVQLQAKIGAIDRQLARLGGRYGGWDKEDHDSFIRSWVQTVPAGVDATELSDSQKRGLLRKLVKSIPMKTEEEMLAHVEWFLISNDLKASKRGLLDQWKSSSSSQRDRSNSAAVSEALDEGQGEDRARADYQPIEDRESTKDRIAKWREKKESEKLTKEQREREARVLEEERLAMSARKRREQNRQRLDEWKRSEESYSKKMEEGETVARKTTRVTTSDLQKRQEQDRDRTQIMLARKEAAQDKLHAREVRIKELERDLPNDLNATRDPTRLTEPTKASRIRKRQEESLVEAEARRAGSSAHNATMAMSGRDLIRSRRAVPSWRAAS